MITIKKNRLQKGETLIETLVSIMVVSITSVLLMSSIDASVRINGKVRTVDDEYRKENEVAERGHGVIEGTITITVTDGDAYTYQVMYAGPVDSIRSYDKKDGGGTPP